MDAATARNTCVTRHLRAGWPANRKRVLIDASKLLDQRVDGIRRYVEELLRELAPIFRLRQHEWVLDVGFGPLGVYGLEDAVKVLDRGRLPRATGPRLLRTDKTSPIRVCRERVGQFDTPFTWPAIRATIRLQSLKAVRSAMRRWNSLSAALQSFLPATKPQYDVIHLTLPNTWKHYRHISGPLLTTVHDLSHIVCPRFQTPQNIRSLQSGLEFSENAWSDYIAVSQSTKLQMEQLLGIGSHRIKVVYEACDQQRFQPVACGGRLKEIRTKYGLPSTPFLLFVGTIEPRKNLLNTVRAFRQLIDESPALEPDLVIAGVQAWGDKHQLTQAVRSCPRIHMAGYIDDEDLPAVYSACAAFCFVSHYEGFGLPLLEAMSCGAPVIYGNVSSLPEIVGGAGIPASPDNVAEIQHAMRQIVESRSLQARLSRKAVMRAREFGWQDTARETFTCYQRLVDRAKNTGPKQMAA